MLIFSGFKAAAFLPQRQPEASFVDITMMSFAVCLQCVCLQCFDAVGWVAGRASGL